MLKVFILKDGYVLRQKMNFLFLKVNHQKSCQTVGHHIFSSRTGAIRGFLLPSVAGSLPHRSSRTEATVEDLK